MHKNFFNKLLLTDYVKKEQKFGFENIVEDYQKKHISKIIVF